MPDTITFTLKAVDVFQILDALNDRAEAWEKTEATFDGNFQSEMRIKG